MDFKDFKAGPDDQDRRLDKVLRKLIPETSLSLIYKYIRKGLIKVNQKKAKQEYHVQNGDILSIAEFIISNNKDSEEFSNTDEKSKKEDKKIIDLPPVVFRNKDLLIINKPYDKTVHGFSDSLDRIVQEEYKLTVKNESLSFTPGPLHRLDKKTTGLLVFSQSLEGAKWFSENIKTHKIQKKYFAVLQGKLNENQHWKDTITKNDETFSGFHTVKAETKNDDNNAETFVSPKLYGQYKNQVFTLAEIEIKTGKTHQIRAQSSLHGFPLLGDKAYGGKTIDKKYPDFFLQAFLLTFPKENPLNLPQKIEIDYSDSLKSFLKDCDVFQISL